VNPANKKCSYGGSGDAQAVLRTASIPEKIGVVTEAMNAESWKTTREGCMESVIAAFENYES